LQIILDFQEQRDGSPEALIDIGKKTKTDEEEPPAS
jgi:hypothetical protein